MKKIGFLGIMLIAAQNITVAQTSFDVNIGSGVWTALCTPVAVDDNMVWNPGASVSTHLGFGMKTVLSSHLTIGVGVRGHYMAENNSYRTQMEGKYSKGSYTLKLGNYTWYSQDDDCDDRQEMFINWDEQDGEGERIVGKKEASTDYAMISVPVKIGYQIGKFNPNFGVEYNYRVGITKNVGELHSVGLTTGLRFDLNDKFAFSTDFYGGLTKDMSHKGTLYYGTRDDENPEKIEIRDFSWRSYRVELSVHYKFGGGSAN
ncbi:MAG: hypothetical protein IKO46_08140 [Salinivirgaceae bacterium]|nr:hypothetical protein [Salinivirgaceae bacterium]MBR4620939.1 hypothetical protein [Salinivirgaceae bacterium]